MINFRGALDGFIWRAADEDDEARAYLDAVRGAAAIAVFVAHVFYTFWFKLVGPHHPASLAAGVIARQAVLIFFLLSGYLIARSIQLNIIRQGEFRVGQFLTSRVTRVYPPLAGAILLCIVVAGILWIFDLPGNYTYGVPGDLFRVRDLFTFRPIEIVQSLAMYGGLLNVDGPLWTLYIEFQIYMIVLGIAVWFQPTWVSRVIWGLVGLGALALARHWYHFIIIWVLGAASALVFPPRRLLIAGAVIATGVVVGICFFEPSTLTDVNDFGIGRILQIGICCLYVLPLFYYPPRFRVPAFLRNTGSFSYSLYIVHFPLLLLVLSATQTWAQRSPAKILAVSIASLPGIIAFAYGFSRIAERQAFFRRQIQQAARFVTRAALG